MEVINQNRFKELKATGQLPSPKGVALALLNLMQQDDVTIQILRASYRPTRPFPGA